MRVETFRTIIVPASVVDQCRAMASAFPGGGMFVTPLYTGSDLTHYISSGHIEQAVADMLDDPAAFAAATGQDLTTVQAIREQMDVSTESWRESLSRLNLSLEPSE